MLRLTVLVVRLAELRMGTLPMVLARANPTCLVVERSPPSRWVPPAPNEGSAMAAPDFFKLRFIRTRKAVTSKSTVAEEAK
eukprot:scaffold341871_cov33-Prasinocladus_malaysianus.AAC.2